MERWRLEHTWRLDPALNMGLDEAALEEADGEPLLRFYTWAPAALSLGYFQRLEEVAERREAAALVRRFTGGGAIHHAEELTFSIALAREHGLYAGAVEESYGRVHRWIARTLARLGLAAELRGARRLASDRPTSGMCFHKSTAVDLVWGERKGVGSAQRRSRGRILHHGSIKLAPDPLEPGVATVADCGRSIAAEELASLLARELESALDLTLARAEPASERWALAERHARHYVDPAFLARR